MKFMKGSLKRSPSTPSFALNSWVTAMADPPRSPCKGPLITFYPDMAANLAECFPSPILFNSHCTNTSTASGHVGKVVAKFPLSGVNDEQPRSVRCCISVKCGVRWYNISAGGINMDEIKYRQYS